jgi:hypothetical protein
MATATLGLTVTALLLEPTGAAVVGVAVVAAAVREVVAVEEEVLAVAVETTKTMTWRHLMQR